MLRGLTYVVLAVLVLSLTGLLSGPLPVTSAATQAVVAPRPSVATAGVRPPVPMLDLSSLRLPPAWSPPAMRAVLGVMRRDPASAQLYARSGTAEPSEDAISGSYATLRPNEMGTMATGRLDGYVHTVIGGIHTRAAQEERNIANIPIGQICYPNCPIGSPGVLYLRCETPGWYVLALHLYHSGSYTFELRNGLSMQDAAGHSTLLLNRTDTVPAAAEYVIPALIQIPSSGRYVIDWHTEVLSAVNPNLVLRAVTVDKIA